MAIISIFSLHVCVYVIHKNKHKNRLIEVEQEQQMRANGSIEDTSAQLEQLKKAVGKAQIEFERVDGYKVEAHVYRVLSGLGFVKSHYNQSCNSFSGGWGTLYLSLFHNI